MARTRDLDQDSIMPKPTARSQELHICFPYSLKEPKILEHAILPSALAGWWIKSGVVRTWTVVIWDSGITGHGFSHYTAIPAPKTTCWSKHSLWCVMVQVVSLSSKQCIWYILFESFSWCLECKQAQIISRSISDWLVLIALQLSVFLDDSWVSTISWHNVKAFTQPSNLKSREKERNRKQ